MTFNESLADQVLGMIKAYPAQHNQAYWASRNDECQTAYCMAGWACKIQDQFQDSDLNYSGSTGFDSATFYRVSHDLGQDIEYRATQLLGLTQSQATMLFDSRNTVPMLENMVKDLASGGLRPYIQYRVEELGEKDENDDSSF